MAPNMDFPTWALNLAEIIVFRNIWSMFWNNEFPYLVVVPNFSSDQLPTSLFKQILRYCTSRFRITVHLYNCLFYNISSNVINYIFHQLLFPTLFLLLLCFYSETCTFGWGWGSVCGWGSASTGPPPTRPPKPPKPLLLSHHHSRPTSHHPLHQRPNHDGVTAYGGRRVGGTRRSVPAAAGT